MTHEEAYSAPADGTCPACGEEKSKMWQTLRIRGKATGAVSASYTVCEECFAKALESGIPSHLKMEAAS